MKAATALQLIRGRAASSERIVLLPHAMARMRERRVDFLQIQRCLLGGAITEGPYIPTDSRTGFWRCSVEATSAGRRLRVAVEIADESTGLLIVTVMTVG